MLSEFAKNIVENIACRVAQRRGGTITPNDVLPYLPVSLDIVKQSLDDMADGASVASKVTDNIVEYAFSAYVNDEPQSGVLAFRTCVACDCDLDTIAKKVLCPDCTDKLRSELNTLAEKNAWPARAVYEHELLHHAAQLATPIPPEKLAGVSRYTLRSTRAKLAQLAADHFARAEKDKTDGVTKYTFPAIDYPRHFYRHNRDIIRSYPASLTEEVQLKVFRILLTLGVMFLGMILLAVWGFPFPILIVIMAIAGPIVAFSIWRHSEQPEDD